MCGGMVCGGMVCGGMVCGGIVCGGMLYNITSKVHVSIHLCKVSTK